MKSILREEKKKQKQMKPNAIFPYPTCKNKSTKALQPSHAKET